METVSKKQRSKNMSAIRSKGNQTTEIKFVKILRANKISGWRRYPKGAYGAPDFIFPKRQIVLFVDGCFWHGCKKHFKIPKTNKKYWGLKIQRNKERDREINKYYKSKNWRVIRVWEHEIKLVKF